MSKFFAIEGGDGTGKSTLASRLVQYFNHSCTPAVLVQDPGGTALGASVRKFIQDPDRGDLSPDAELLLFSAAKVQLYNEKIRPALKEGQLVISDRYSLSTAIYQGFARGKHMGDFLRAAESVSPPDPHAYIVLTASPDAVRERLSKRYSEGDAKSFYEKREAFMTSVNEGFRHAQLWTRSPVYTIDTDNISADEVFNLATRYICDELDD